MIRYSPTHSVLPEPALIGALLQRDRSVAVTGELREFARVGIDRGEPGEDADSRLQPAPAAPTQRERSVMVAHGIQFDGRGFRFAGFRYDRLIDAVHQSRRSGQGCE